MIQISLICPHDGSLTSKGLGDDWIGLASLIRANSFRSAIPFNGQTIIKLTGYDGHDYAIQVSSNLVDWKTVSTNSPIGGLMMLINASSSNITAQFYRSILLN
ncbi:MAG TPA: hypothetical protein VFY06_15385 [Verrucomicrobiae bacterium]|nr:hypothetical protein [Verrucomicrobiae bacterium]